MEDQRNESRRARLVNIVQSDFAGDIDAVVWAIKQATGQDVSVRTVQTWLIAPHRVSHRKVPDWALCGIEDFIRQPENRESLQRNVRPVASRRLGRVGALEWAAEVGSSLAVDFATAEMEWEEKQREKWRRTFGIASGDVLFQAFNEQTREINWLGDILNAVTQGLQDSSTFDEFKTHMNDAIRGRNIEKFHIREARKDVEQHIEKSVQDRPKSPIGGAS